MDIETEPIQEAEMPRPSPKINEQNISKQGHRREIKSQKSVKGNLEYILQAIDIEGTRVARAEDIEGDKKKKKKGKTVKKLDFVGEDVGFLFQPRKSLTRLQLAKGAMENKKTEYVEKGTKPIIEDIIDLSPKIE